MQPTGPVRGRPAAGPDRTEEGLPAGQTKAVGALGAAVGAAVSAAGAVIPVGAAVGAAVGAVSAVGAHPQPEGGDNDRVEECLLERSAQQLSVSVWLSVSQDVSVCPEPLSLSGWTSVVMDY